MQKATVDSAKVIDQYKQAYKQLEIVWTFITYYICSLQLLKDHQKLLNTAQAQETEIVSLQGQLRCVNLFSQFLEHMYLSLQSM